MIKILLPIFKNYYSVFFEQTLNQKLTIYRLRFKLQLLALILIAVNSVSNAQEVAAVRTNSSMSGTWKLVSAEVLNPSNSEVLNAETFLFRDAVKHKTPITFKRDGVFQFQKDGIAQNWKFRIKENGVVHLIEYEKTDSKGEKSSAYIDYHYEVNGNQLKLFRKDNASQEQYQFSLIK